MKELKAKVGDKVILLPFGGHTIATVIAVNPTDVYPYTVQWQITQQMSFDDAGIKVVEAASEGVKP